MKHFLIYFFAFLVVITLAVFNLGLISGQNYQWSGNASPGPVSLPAGVQCSPNQANDSLSASSTLPTADGVAAEIQVDSPQSNAIVSSPLVITGKVKGSWYFEGTFPIKLIGENGIIVAQGQAAAQSDWTSQDFVPFTATLNFANASSTIGILVFSNDNPSGLPQNEKEFGVPVRFSAQKQVPVKLYFSNSDLAQNSTDCNLVYPVSRLIPDTPTIARATLEQLLSGPSSEEKAQGYFSSINTGVKINKVTIYKDGTLAVDLDPQLVNNIGGSCRVAAIRAQITQTLEQFPSVKSVVISVNGATDQVLQP